MKSGSTLELNQIYNGDCREVMKDIDDNSIDSIVTDPPYELGFMSKKWDNTGIAYDVDVWKECLRVLKPGGYLLSFGGTRTYHRMACAIEDAGFEIRDQMQYLYGSGFPKSLNIGKAIDEWQGWGTALKPANEPICMARKPLEEKTVAKNVLKYGTGGINIDGCRVGESGARNNGSKPKEDGYRKNEIFGKYRPTEKINYGIGRFPANVIHDGSDEVVGLFPNSKSTGGTGELSKGKMGNLNWSGQATGGFGDSGSAARFFYCAKASKKERNEGCEELADSIGGGTKGTQDKTLLTGSGNIRNNITKNNHPTVKPISLMKYLLRLVTPPKGISLDPFAGSGTTCKAAVMEGFNYIGIEKEKEYCIIAENRIAAEDDQLKLDI